ncbi:MAG: diadenylate cyclase CdaA [Tannerellaceae bacterium]|jgi:uncharacterized protein (TIGR00159 family)|nr:diadenylate cyclase CdaA [Tannerellaceae bacterium]
MWMHLGIKDMVDILLVAVFLYQVYKLMKASGTMTLFTGIIAFLVVWVLVSQVLEMRLMGAILDKFISVGVLVLVILFQDEIRRFLFALGSHRRWKIFSYIFKGKSGNDEDGNKYIAPVVLACMNMGRKKTGALIVIRREMDLSVYEHTGEMFDADVNARLIENIFFKNSPLHDGAMIISGNRIKAAACILPVARHALLPKDFGLRHRSGLGMSMETDALIIIVSEERGRISVAREGRLAANVTAEELQQILSGEREVSSFC